ncbi:hypothetical protein J3A83DRAFT_4401881 [Scleroderma citrinum]
MHQDLSPQVRASTLMIQLTAIFKGGTIAVSTTTGAQGQQLSDQDDLNAEEAPGDGSFGGAAMVSHPHISEISMCEVEEEEVSEEESGAKEGAGGGLELDLMPIDPQVAFEAFHMSPYTRPPLFTWSMSMTTSTPSSSGWCQVTSSETSQTKGKSMLVQMKADLDEQLGGLNDSSTDQWYRLAMLKNKHKLIKMHAYMCDKKIIHLESENNKDCLEAENISRHFLEGQKLDIKYLKEEGEVLCLKLELAKLQASISCSPSSNSTAPSSNPASSMST